MTGLILLLVFCFTGSAVAESQPTDWPYSAVCKVRAGGRGGSGTLIGVSGTRGLIVTANHVAGRSRTVELTFPGGYQTTGTVLASDAALDICVIEATVLATMRTPRRVRAAREGDELVAIGYPYYSRQTPCWTKGTFLRYAGNKVVVATPRPIASGFSGGCLIAADGSYCGPTNWARRGETLAASGHAMEQFLSRWIQVGK